MTTVVAASVGAAVFGPLTLAVARRSMTTSWHPGRTETAAVVAATGLVSAMVAAGRWWAVPTVLPLALAGPAAAVVDAREGRLPDLLTGPLCGTTLLITLVSGSGSVRLLAAVTAIVVGAAVVASLAPDVLGWGDVKLLPTLALVTGSGDRPLDAGPVAVVLLLAVTAVLVWLRDRRALVPYGPALVIGTLCGISA